ncbi:hypothetical protein ANN_07006 [Periplaneta americana]|uniref:Tc1-like transposase DDE domain-containing protein n=1 Tax=Periplaneta americana TaxID=6978 RepID=A0ABQ8TH88_PERAM|nr:hypothetical protein ANN_07006 [Periplaneta americana]
MAGLCEGGNEPPGSLEAICNSKIRVMFGRDAVSHSQAPPSVWEMPACLKPSRRRKSDIAQSKGVHLFISDDESEGQERLRKEAHERIVNVTSLLMLGQKAWVYITARLEKPTYYGRNDHDFKIKCRKQKTDDIHWNASPFLLQHGTQLDNGSWPHVSAATMQWYADNNVHRLDWPSQSPDLNPNEHLWDKLDRRLRSREMRPTSIAQLSAILQEEWRRIPVDILHKLVENMPDMMAAVIATRGGTTRV